MKMRPCPWFNFAIVLLGVAALFGLPQREDAQTPGASSLGAGKQQLTRAKLLEILDQRIDMKPLQQAGKMRLNEAVKRLCDIVKATGKDLPVFIDEIAFKAENPDAPDLADSQVHFEPIPSEMTVGAALSSALVQVDTRNGTYVVMPEYILVTTFINTSPAAKLNAKVRGIFEKRPLNSVFAELAERVGATIIIDNRAAEKAKMEVSADFRNDIDLAGALRVLTEMADLKVLALDGVLFVTSPSHAEAVRKEHIQKMTENEKIMEIKQKAPVRHYEGLPGAANILGTGVFSSGQMTYREPIIDPFWPYLPQPGVGRIPESD
jgi:hypothetical protein